MMNKLLRVTVIAVYFGLISIILGCTSSSKPTIKVGEYYYFSSTSNENILSCNEFGCYSQWRIEIINDHIGKLCSYPLDGPSSFACCTEIMYSYNKEDGVFEITGGFRDDESQVCIEKFRGSWILGKYGKNTQVFYSQNIKGAFFFVDL